MIIFFTNFIFYSLLSLFSSKEIRDILSSHSNYYIVKEVVYHYKVELPYNMLIFQCENKINLLCFDDQNAIKKHFNGSYYNYIAVKNDRNIIFDLNNTKSVDFYFISDNTCYCLFINVKKETSIVYSEFNLHNWKSLKISYKIGYPLKINIYFPFQLYLNIQFKNYLNFSFYENNTKLENINEKNCLIKLIPENHYYITYLNDNNFEYSMQFLKGEINEITYDELQLEIIYPSVYYFYTNKGFEKGGIKIYKNSFSNILCKKIDNVENIQEINYKEILKDTYDCIINSDLIQYPVLEDKSYFIFSATLYSNPYIYLYNEKEPKKKEEKKSKSEIEKTIERIKRKKNSGKWALIFFVIFVVGTPIFLILYKFNLFCFLDDKYGCFWPINLIMLIIYLSPISFIPCIICFIIYLVS